MKEPRWVFINLLENHVAKETGSLPESSTLSKDVGFPRFKVKGLQHRAASQTKKRNLFRTTGLCR